MKPKIGIVGTIGGNTFGVDVKYMQFASLFGDVHILTPDTPIIDLDLLILKGGADINPANYGQKPGYIISNSNPFLEEFDNEKLPQYIEKETPIFGICRGMQALNVYFGGTLSQHIYDHETNSDGDRESYVHYVKSEKSKPFGVNSMHHQAIKKLGDGLVQTLFECDEKGILCSDIIEGIRHERLPIIGVQWHPEEILDEYSINAINSLLKID